MESHQFLHTSLMSFETADTRATGEDAPALLSRGTLSSGGCGTRAQKFCSLGRAPGFFSTAAIK
jgi:hypothetical protein